MPIVIPGVNKQDVSPDDNMQKGEVNDRIHDNEEVTDRIPNNRQVPE